jgi:FKBP-type peptidyl-prolyl cis-trans isomerase
LFYQIYEHGSGEAASTGKFVTINYLVSLLDGTICYNSDDSGSKKFIIGRSNEESGLEQGVLMMRVGDKARFIMPPHLAHGLLGDENKIPPRSIIVYEVELVEISD